MFDSLTEDEAAIETKASTKRDKEEAEKEQNEAVKAAKEEAEKEKVEAVKAAKEEVKEAVKAAKEEAEKEKNKMEAENFTLKMAKASVLGKSLTDVSSKAEIEHSPEENVSIERQVSMERRLAQAAAFSNTSHIPEAENGTRNRDENGTRNKDEKIESVQKSNEEEATVSFEVNL